jgi:hypothetical protein
VLKNDRAMSILTVVAIMLAVGPFIHRLGFLEGYLGNATAAVELRQDKVIVPANSLAFIDVLANDLGLQDGDADNLIIAVQPKCGRVFARNKQAEYQPSVKCVGSQSFSYTIHGRSLSRTGQVTVVVRVDTPTQNPIVAHTQIDATVPTPSEPRVLVARDAAPSLLATEPAAVIVSAAIQPPAVPRPLIPAISGLPDTTTAAYAADGVIAVGAALNGLDPLSRAAGPIASFAEETVVGATVLEWHIPLPPPAPRVGALDPATQAYPALIITATEQPPMPRPLRRSM